MVKKSMAKSARKTLTKATQAGSKKVTRVAGGRYLGVAAAAATGVILREFAEALGAKRKQNGDISETGKVNVVAEKSKRRAQKSA